MAQLVEQLIRNQQVGGSSPPSSSKSVEIKSFGVFLCLKSVNQTIIITEKYVKLINLWVRIWVRCRENLKSTIE